MIEAGKFFCPRCAAISVNAFYINSEHADRGLRLNHTRTGEFSLDVYDISNDKMQEVSETVVLTTKPSADSAGIPRQLWVRFSGESNPSRAVRCCPHCRSELFLNHGEQPMYVIAMVGDRGAGKTAWLDAVSNPTNTSKLYDAGYPNKLDFVNISSKTGISAATAANNLGSTRFLQILNARDNNKVVAQVLLRDVAGELFTDTPDTLWQLLTPNGEYPGPDGFVFVEPPEGMKKYPGKQGTTAADILNRCRINGVFQGHPVAWVETHLDARIEQKKFPKVSNTGLDAMSATTFQNAKGDPGYYRKNVLLDRIAKQNSICFGAIGPDVLLAKSGSARQGFLVQSCSTHPGMVEKLDDNGNPVLDQDGNPVLEPGIVEDRTNSINVMDPLVWLLHQLKLFPLE